MVGLGSPGPCSAAIDQVGSGDSVMMLTRTPSHAGACSGLDRSGPVCGRSGASIALAFSGPVTESNGLRDRIGSASLLGLLRPARAPRSIAFLGACTNDCSSTPNDAPSRVVAPEAWK
jgi:hypothetical protein